MSERKHLKPMIKLDLSKSKENIKYNPDTKELTIKKDATGKVKQIDKKHREWIKEIIIRNNKESEEEYNDK